MYHICTVVPVHVFDLMYYVVDVHEADVLVLYIKSKLICSFHTSLLPDAAA